MLTAASLGMALYGLYSILAGVTDLVAATQLEWWANLWLIGAGTMLVLGAAFVRVSMPVGSRLRSAASSRCSRSASTMPATCTVGCP